MKKLSGWCPRVLAATLLLGAAGGTSAADLGFYVVLDSTANTAHIPLSDFNEQLTAFVDQAEPLTDIAVDTGNWRYAMTVGYQLGSYFALEGSYFDLGKIRYEYASSSGEQTGRFKLKPRGPSFSAVGFLPLGPYFSADAHAGLAFLDNKYKVSFGGQEISFSDSRTAVYYGGGVSWWITGLVALRVGYNSFLNGESLFFNKNISQYTFGLRYSYGY